MPCHICKQPDCPGPSVCCAPVVQADEEAAPMDKDTEKLVRDFLDGEPPINSGEKA